jgi:hypothetical protein
LCITTFRRCTDYSNATIPALLVIKCVDGVTLRRFSFNLLNTGITLGSARADERVEVASGPLVNFRPAGGGVRTSKNSTLNGEGLSRAPSLSNAIGEKKWSVTCISGRFGGFADTSEESQKGFWPLLPLLKAAKAAKAPKWLTLSPAESI